MADITSSEKSIARLSLEPEPIEALTEPKVAMHDDTILQPTLTTEDRLLASATKGFEFVLNNDLERAKEQCERTISRTSANHPRSGRHRLRES